jgi:hypothetical protein
MIREFCNKRFANLILGSLVTWIASFPLAGSDAHAGPISRGILELFEEAVSGARVLGLQGAKKSAIHGSQANSTAFEEISLEKFSLLASLKTKSELFYSGTASFPGRNEELKITRHLRLGEVAVRGNKRYKTVVDELAIDIGDAKSPDVIRVRETQFFEADTEFIPSFSVLEDGESKTTLSFKREENLKTLTVNNKFLMGTYVEKDTKGTVLARGEISGEPMISKRGEPVICITSMEKSRVSPKYSAESTCTYYDRLSLLPRMLISNVTLDDGELFSMKLELKD